MACERDKLATVVEAGLDPFEHAVLDIVHCYCHSYAHPNAMSWEAAFDSAATRFGPQGSRVAHATMAMLRALRLARRSTFNFVNPFCPCCSKRITPHEVKFMRLLRAMRKGDTATARTEALILSEGGASAGFLDAARDLAELDTGEGLRPVMMS